MLPQIDHIAIRVSDLEASIKFYHNLLNCKLLSTTLDQENHEAFAFMEFSGASLELLQLLDENNRILPFDKPEIEKPYCPHIAIKSENFDLLIERLQKLNITIIKGPLEIPGMVKWLYIADPDNNVIEFVEWLK